MELEAEGISRAVGKCSGLVSLRTLLTPTHYSCGETGHMARQCPTAPEGSGNDGKCFNCGEEG